MAQEIKKGYLHSYGAIFIFLIAILDILVIICTFKFVLFASGVSESKDYIFTLAITLIVFIAIALSLSFYRSHRTNTISSEIAELFMYWLFTFMTISALVYLFEQKMPVSPSLLQIWFVAAYVLLVLSRIAIRTIAHKLRSVGRNYRNVAIIGSTLISERVYNSIVRNDWMGLKFEGFYDDRCSIREKLDIDNLSVHRIDKLFEKIAEDKVDIVYITLPMSAQTRIKEFIELLSHTNVAIYYAPDFYSFDLLRAHWESIDGQPVISIIETPLLGDNNMLKRAEDIILSACILAFIAIPMLLVSLLIKLDSKGPVIYKQKRYGLDSKSFTIYKFRTMRPSHDDQIFKQATEDDPRVTKLGKWMRKYSVDELPQFINVLQGRMSVVGPRPHPLALDDEHLSLIRRYNLRFKVKPGITGWAQVNGYRGETKNLGIMDKRIRYDLEYISQWSLLFDIKIVLLTLKSVVKPVNAF